MSTYGNISKGNIITSDGFYKALCDLNEKLTDFVKDKIPKYFSDTIEYSIGVSGNKEGDAWHTYETGKNVPTIPLSCYRDIDVSVPDKPTEGTVITIMDVYDKLLSLVNMYKYYTYVTSTWYTKTVSSNNKGNVKVLLSTEKGYASIDDPNKGLVHTDITKQKIESTGGITQIPYIGDVISADQSNNNIDDLFNYWKDNIKSVEYVVTTCHYVCYAQYNNRVRR